MPTSVPSNESFWSSGPGSSSKAIWIFILPLMLSGCGGASLRPELEAELRSDWRFASSIHGESASALHRQIFGNGSLDGESYRRFFNQRVSEVKEEGILLASCHGALACETGNRIVRLSESYHSLGLPPIIRLSYLIHEARHVDGWAHARCPDPFRDSAGMDVITPYQRVRLGGEDACDDQALGAYGVQVVMLRNISRYCVSCGTTVRQQARAFADFLLNLISSKEARERLQADDS